LFSIVIPTFNRSDLVPYAVQSILNQTFEDFEVIVSDNCSADDTPQQIKQFTDPRVKYVRTPRHFTIGDAWEFASSLAIGKVIVMLSDDDTLISSALERVACEMQRHDADFVIGNCAEYRDRSYPGADQNSVDCPAFSGLSRIVQAEELIRPLFSFERRVGMFPSASASAFRKTVAEHVRDRTGRFFWTNGVEYASLPIAAVLARRILHIDSPLAIMGRTGKSWGPNLVLCNPGKERIQEFINDVDHERKHAPLNNFTLCNLMAEGILTAKHLFPKEFAAYEFDEIRYLRSTMAELRERQTLGVDVSEEIEDVLRYTVKYPALLKQFEVPVPAQSRTLSARIRSTVGDLGGRALRERINALRLARKLKRGDGSSNFRASGKHFGFSNILECTEFLSRTVMPLRSEASVVNGRTNEILCREQL
jgi:glycosyltransferase involved in cell wall biosynthesis